MKKEDRIGTIYKCSMCGVETEVTEKGVKHQCADTKHWAYFTLGTYHEYKNAYADFEKQMAVAERRLLYGEKEDV